MLLLHIHTPTHKRRKFSINVEPTPCIFYSPFSCYENYKNYQETVPLPRILIVIKNIHKTLKLLIKLELNSLYTIRYKPHAGIFPRDNFFSFFHELKCPPKLDYTKFFKSTSQIHKLSMSFKIHFSLPSQGSCSKYTYILWETTDFLSPVSDLHHPSTTLLLLVIS